MSCVGRPPAMRVSVGSPVRPNSIERAGGAERRRVLARLRPRIAEARPRAATVATAPRSSRARTAGSARRCGRCRRRPRAAGCSADRRSSGCGSRSGRTCDSVGLACTSTLPPALSESAVNSCSVRVVVRGARQVRVRQPGEHLAREGRHRDRRAGRDRPCRSAGRGRPPAGCPAAAPASAMRGESRDAFASGASLRSRRRRTPGS